VRNNGLSVVRILTALFFIKTDDIAAVLDPDFLDFERGRILGIAALRNTLQPLLAAAQAPRRLTSFWRRILTPMM
jgi:hypothetical protein